MMRVSVISVTVSHKYDYFHRKDLPKMYKILTFSYYILRNYLNSCDGNERQLRRDEY